MMWLLALSCVLEGASGTYCATCGDTGYECDEYEVGDDIYEDIAPGLITTRLGAAQYTVRPRGTITRRENEVVSIDVEEVDGELPESLNLTTLYIVSENSPQPVTVQTEACRNERQLDIELTCAEMLEGVEIASAYRALLVEEVRVRGGEKFHVGPIEYQEQDGLLTIEACSSSTYRVFAAWLNPPL